MQYFISPKVAKFQPFQRQETPVSSVTEKHRSADILQEAWGDLFPWSSTFFQFNAALPNLGLQIRHTHHSPQPTPRWYGDYVNQKEFETFNKNQLFPRVSAEPLRFPLWVKGHKAREEKGWAGKNMYMSTIWTLPLSECQGQWTRRSRVPYSRQEHPSVNKWAVCVMEYPQPMGSAVDSLSALPEQHPLWTCSRWSGGVGKGLSWTIMKGRLGKQERRKVEAEGIMSKGGNTNLL